MNIHPKTSGAAVGSSLGVLIVAVLGSIHGVHLTASADGAIPAFLGILGAWLVPAGDTATTPAAPQRASAPVPPAAAAPPAVPPTVQ